MGCLDGEAEDYVCDYHLEMLSLSQDQQNPTSIQFDDLSWQCHLPSLKPLGLNIMLNLCNASVTQQLCRFSDHLSNLALQESHGTVLPVYVPWGLCELSRLIGQLVMFVLLQWLSQNELITVNLEKAIIHRQMKKTEFVSGIGGSDWVFIMIKHFVIYTLLNVR